MEKRLGKGLSALITETTGKVNEKVERLRLTDIVPNPFQPRTKFNETEMDELVSSIREKGIIQPILVRPAGDGYEIVAGERRFRAAQRLQYEEISAIVRSGIDDVSSLEIALIENIQRAELNAIEEARAYRELTEKFEYTLDKVGQMVGKDKTTISNSLRILTLSDKIQEYIKEGKISAGHGKALLSIPGERRREKIARLIVRKGLSVRETENLARKVSIAVPKKQSTKDPETAQIEETLQHKLGTKVSLIQGKKRGKIEIQYFSNEDLSRLLRLILGE